MDLDTMKSVINRKLEEHPTGHVRSDFHFNPHTSTLLQKISRNIRWELALYLIFGIAFIIMVFVEKQKPLKIYFGIFSIPMLILVPVFHTLLKRIEILMQTAAPVKDAIAELLYILKLYSRRYQQFNTLMVPVCTFTLFFLYENRIDNSSLFIFISLTAVITIISHFISKGYVNWLYGNHIRELEKQLKEFDGFDE